MRKSLVASDQVYAYNEGEHEEPQAGHRAKVFVRWSMPFLLSNKLTCIYEVSRRGTCSSAVGRTLPVGLASKVWKSITSRCMRPCRKMPVGTATTSRHRPKFILRGLNYECIAQRITCATSRKRRCETQAESASESKQQLPS